MKKLILIALMGTSPAFAQMALNPAVTQANIGETICRTGWVKTVRPSLKYTSMIKRQLLVNQGIPKQNSALYELDHVVPLELGGHPSSPTNLVLQPWDGPTGAHVKDKLENRLHRLVCSNKVTLHDAQVCIYSDWRACRK